MKIFLKSIAFLYLLGFIFHFLDLIGLRYEFSKMNNIWKAWTITIGFGDLVVFLGLIRNKLYGQFAFVFIGVVQLVGYCFFVDVFGEQTLLIYFHIFSLGIFTYLKLNLNTESS